MLLGIVLYLVLINARVRIGRSHRAAVAVVAVVAAVYVAAMGLSPEYLGQHWLTGVAAGLLIGVGWVLSVVLAKWAWVAVRRGRASTVPSGGDDRAAHPGAGPLA